MGETGPRGEQVVKGQCPWDDRGRSNWDARATIHSISLRGNRARLRHLDGPKTVYRNSNPSEEHETMGKENSYPASSNGGINIQKSQAWDASRSPTLAPSPSPTGITEQRPSACGSKPLEVEECLDRNGLSNEGCIDSSWGVLKHNRDQEAGTIEQIDVWRRKKQYRRLGNMRDRSMEGSGPRADTFPVRRSPEPRVRVVC